MKKGSKTLTMTPLQEAEAELKRYQTELEQIERQMLECSLAEKAFWSNQPLPGASLDKHQAYRQGVQQYSKRYTKLSHRHNEIKSLIAIAEQQILNEQRRIDVVRIKIRDCENQIGLHNSQIAKLQARMDEFLRLRDSVYEEMAILQEQLVEMVGEDAR